MAGVMSFFLRATTFAAAAALLMSCGGDRRGARQEGVSVTITLGIPDTTTAERDAVSSKFLKAFERSVAREITDVSKGPHVLEITMRISELSAINDIKRAIIEIDPGTEYRIEHL